MTPKVPRAPEKSWRQSQRNPFSLPIFLIKKKKKSLKKGNCREYTKLSRVQEKHNVI